MNKGSKVFEKLMFLFFAQTILLSCSKDWFDIKSDKNVTILTTLREFEMLLDNYESVSKSAALGEVASDGHYISDATWITLVNVPVNEVQKNAYTWSKRNLNNDVKDWNVSYSIIFNCNLVLEGLDKIERNETNSDFFDRVKGNALFQRARIYFELSQIFTPPFDAKSDNKYGLPFKESTDVSEVLKRISVHNTFGKIESDLGIAAELLPVKASKLTRGSKIACWAYLARISLIKGQFDEALRFANLVLEVKHELLDYNLIPLNAPNLGIFNSEVIFHTEMNNLAFTFHPIYCFIDPSLFDLYDSDDLRKQAFFRIGPTGILFKGMYNNRIIQFAGIANDEIYLIKSEALARLNRVAESMKVINELLKSRYKRNLDGSSTLVGRNASNEIDALQIIYTERRKELLLRGIRWSDLRRFSKDSLFSVVLHRKINGEEFILQPSSLRYAFPIPDDEISYSKIEQNPGWE